jgi:hypothetical protein
MERANHLGGKGREVWILWGGGAQHTNTICKHFPKVAGTSMTTHRFTYMWSRMKLQWEPKADKLHGDWMKVKPIQ